jgi:hypothetical protein
MRSARAADHDHGNAAEAVQALPLLIEGFRRHDFTLGIFHIASPSVHSAGKSRPQLTTGLNKKIRKLMTAKAVAALNLLCSETFRPKFSLNRPSRIS